MDVVEIDAEMLSVAEKWFGFVQGERMKVFIEDGLLFVKEAKKQGLKAILLFQAPLGWMNNIMLRIISGTTI